jgi:hypothetical protein
MPWARPGRRHPLPNDVMARADLRLASQAATTRGKLRHVILGIGLNVNQRGFPIRYGSRPR